MNYYPEGVNPSLVKKFENTDELKDAIDSREIFEGVVTMCDAKHNLYIDMGRYTGLLPRLEGALGILEGTTRDIALISKVNRLICYRVMGLHRGEKGEIVPILSRRNVQLECEEKYINTLVPGDIIPAKVTRPEGFGAFIDIGCGINSLIPIDMLSVSRISHTAERLYSSEVIKTALKSRENNKLTFTLRELLGTWEENAKNFSPGETVRGIVRSVESYGVFIELTPNLTGLADPRDDLKKGQTVSVFIKSISKNRMKIKLAVVEKFDEISKPDELKYYVDSPHIDEWVYSPAESGKLIYTNFQRYTNF